MSINCRVILLTNDRVEGKFIYYVITYRGHVSRFFASDLGACRQNVSRAVRRIGRMPSSSSLGRFRPWRRGSWGLRGRRSKSRVIISAHEWYLGEWNAIGAGSAVHERLAGGCTERVVGGHRRDGTDARRGGGREGRINYQRYLGDRICRRSHRWHVPDNDGVPLHPTAKWRGPHTH